MGVISYALNNPGSTPGGFKGVGKKDTSKSGGGGGYPGILYQPPTPSGGGGGNGGGGGGGAGGGSGSFGGGGGTVVDPLAELMKGFTNQKSNIFGTSKEAAKNVGLNLRGSILDFVNSLSTGQRNIDERGVQNELAKRQGYQGVQGMVGRGIKSGGVVLAGGNASDSSAAEGIARAYGDIGRRELTGVLSDYVLENRGINQSQEEFDRLRKAGVRNIKDDKTEAINNIVIDARGKLAALDAAMLEAEIPERINIEKEKNKIKNEVIGMLQRYDKMLKNRVGEINPSSKAQRKATAAKLALAGVAPEDSFDYSESVPMQFQGTGPFTSELPIFTRPPDDEE